MDAAPPKKKLKTTAAEGDVAPAEAAEAVQNGKRSEKNGEHELVEEEGMEEEEEVEEDQEEDAPDVEVVGETPEQAGNGVPTKAAVKAAAAPAKQDEEKAVAAGGGDDED